MVSPMFDARLTGSAIGGFLPAEPEGSTRRRVLMVTHDFPPSLTMAGETCAQIARYLRVKFRHFADSLSTHCV